MCIRDSQDRDGIPNLVHPDIFSIADLKLWDKIPPENRINPYPYLESPGLIAIIINEISRLESLKETCQSEIKGGLLEKKKILVDHLRESWQADLAGFQNRDSISHISVDGCIIRNQLPSGFTRLQVDLPQPSRIVLLFAPDPAGNPNQDPSIVIHGSCLLYTSPSPRDRS